MRFTYETFTEKEARVEQWHRWFAWHPVWENGTIYWLEPVERRGVWKYGGFYWEYRPTTTGAEEDSCE